MDMTSPPVLTFRAFPAEPAFAFEMWVHGAGCSDEGGARHPLGRLVARPTFRDARHARAIRDVPFTEQPWVQVTEFA